MASETYRPDGLLAANLMAANQFAALALDGTGQLLKNQGDLLQRACEWSESEYRHFWSGNGGAPLDYLPELMAHRLDFAAEMTKGYFDLLAQYQDGLADIGKSLMPSVQHYLAEAAAGKTESVPRARRR